MNAGPSARRVTYVLVALCLAALSAAPGSAKPATKATSPPPKLSATPYMGWSTYYGVGGRFNEQTITSVADSLISTGLAQAGYRIVWLDFGWASGARDSNGNLIVNSNQWPDGMSGLTAYLHQRGLLAGIYTDAGASGCFGQGVGSLNHYQQDADAFAAWGFDAVKVDFCGAGQEGLTPQAQYAQFASALANNSSHRPMLLNVDNFWEPGQIDGTNPTSANSAFSNYQWAPQIAQSWRTDTDLGRGNGIQFANVLRNLDADAAHPEAAGPGHWNDPDNLGPELGMTAAEAQAQLSMWAILAAPLMLGSDPRALSPQSIAMLKDPQVIAVDQDPLGVQGRPIQTEGSGQVWVKPLADGGRAVGLLNGGAAPQQITTSASELGLPPAGTFQVQDLWAGTTTLTTGTIGATVGPDSADLFRVSALPAVAAVAGPSGELYVHAPDLSAPWQSLGGDLFAAPAVAAAPRRPGTYSAALFVAVSRDHTLYVRSVRTAWRKLVPSNCLDSPAASVVGSDLYVACEGSDHALWYGMSRLSGHRLPRLKRLDSLGGKLSAGPAIAPVRGRPTFFVSGSDHRLYTRTPTRRFIRFSFPCYGHPAAAPAPDGAVTYAACESAAGGLSLMITTRRGWSARTNYGGANLIGGPGVAVTSAGAVFWATARGGHLLFTSTPNGWADGMIGGIRGGASADGVG
jgi:Alpha galactosidase A/Alpha galactosidase C-terminal beta sandwich domain